MRNSFFRKFCLDAGGAQSTASLVFLTRLPSLTYSCVEVCKFRSLNTASKPALGQNIRFFLISQELRNAVICLQGKAGSCSSQRESGEFLEVTPASRWYAVPQNWAGVSLCCSLNKRSESFLRFLLLAPSRQHSRKRNWATGGKQEDSLKGQNWLKYGRKGRKK